jgi:hypothetical protein
MSALCPGGGTTVRQTPRGKARVSATLSVRVAHVPPKLPLEMPPSGISHDRSAEQHALDGCSGLARAIGASRLHSSRPAGAALSAGWPVVASKSAGWRADVARGRPGSRSVVGDARRHAPWAPCGAMPTHTLASHTPAHFIARSHPSDLPTGMADAPQHGAMPRNSRRRGAAPFVVTYPQRPRVRATTTPSRRARSGHYDCALHHPTLFVQRDGTVRCITPTRSAIRFSISY